MLFIMFLLAHAHAVVIAGNPELVVEAAQPGETLSQATAGLDTVVFEGCDAVTTHTIQVQASVDLAAGWRTTAPDGDWCSVTLHWDDDIVLSGTNGNGDWSVVATPSSTVVDTDPEPSPAQITPAQVVYGVVIAGNPELITRFE